MHILLKLKKKALFSLRSFTALSLSPQAVPQKTSLVESMIGRLAQHNGSVEGIFFVGGVGVG